jgi:hypothetical protein
VRNNNYTNEEQTMIDTTPIHARLWGPSRAHRARASKHLNERAALDLLRKPGHLLCLLHAKTGRDYFIVPGGPVTPTVAQKILERPDVQPHDSGLLEGHPQSWRLGPWR